MKIDTVESITAQAVLQQSEEIAIGGKTYQVAPPTVATLILVSELISLMPEVKSDTEEILTESLYVAKDCRVVGDILATLILGAKRLTETTKVVGTRLLGLVKDESEVVVNKKEILAKAILEELSPKQVNQITSRLLSKMEVAFFFAISTSLSGINLLRQTKQTKTTASGQ